MFVWLFHRISGLVLIVLIGIKIISGYAFIGEIDAPSAEFLHSNKTIDIFIIFLFTFHSLYGLRTLLIDVGVKSERALFWSFSGAALAISCLATYLIYIR
jgi:succinate dehydrogenase/fumarate reductase cytochrome b subunit